MYYHAELKPYEFMNIYNDLKNNSKPLIVRFDINSPVNRNGRISSGNGHVNLRLEESSYLLRAYSKLGPLVLMAHQGRKHPPGTKPDKNFVTLLDHHKILSEISGIRIHFIEYADGETWDEYSENVGKHLTKLKQGEAILMDNVRQWDFENKFNPTSCPYISWFKDYDPVAFINDGLPVWHRAESSLMFGRHVAPTYIGHISMRELRIQHKILHSSEKKAIIIGGKKPKFEAIPNLVKKMDIFTAGITGILTTKLYGNEIGPRNDELLKTTFKGMEHAIKGYNEILEDNTVMYPVDFVLSQPENQSPRNRINVRLTEISKPKYEDYEIFDIGEETVRLYANKINAGGYEWRIRAGPNGVFEEGFDNGIKLIEHLLGTGFVAIGGDTIEELQKYEICKTIMYSDGSILLGGGSHLEGFAGNVYPCIQDLVENGCISLGREDSSE